MKAPRSKYYKLSVCDGMEALDASNYNTPFPSHYHPTFNISLVYDGVFQAKLNDRSVGATPGTILITNPQEIHANPCDKEDSLSFFTFYLSRDFLNYCNESKQVGFAEKIIDDPKLFAELNKLKLSLNNGEPPMNFEGELVKNLKLLAVNHGTNSPEESNDMHALFEDFLAEENFEKFSLEDAARRFGIDKFKFLRLFKFQTGLTPNNYFILKRIEKSKIMLAEGRDLLSVAIDLGFYDTAHFCNHFKKFTGISPIAYTAGS
ncbi:AraC family transcriptional regulator [soil metagenome]|jgi:AraC-like DNA-binding protein